MENVIYIRCPYTDEYFALDYSRDNPFEGLALPQTLVFAEVWKRGKHPTSVLWGRGNEKTTDEGIRNAILDRLSDYKSGFSNAVVVWINAAGTGPVDEAYPSPGTCKAIFSDRPDEFRDFVLAQLGPR